MNGLEKIKKVDKLWGYELWFTNNDKYCCKLLHIDKGAHCSSHYHLLKQESFIPIKGKLWLEVEGDVYILAERQAFTIEQSIRHRFWTEDEYCEFIEASTHHEDSDSYRLEPSGYFKDGEFINEHLCQK